ncbi:C-type lectin domain family 14 member A [Perognathus longimembris pacificus]|uniref:C-type lectin domain family 14 member A n=1 Tax=Perognathus longimembris pacificus TaxID=214514 RepID=UPI00201A1FF7|nr:C-type lectin domain family 14 member A [Perognathus longimembris pacificus]
MRPALALCLLCQAFWPRPGGGEHPTADRAGCSASGACYSLHHATIKRVAAQEACNLRGGTLSTVHGGAELRAVLALLRAGPGPGGGSKDLLFWVALERGRSHCTLENEPLRGFSWLSPDAAGESDSATLPWVAEPQLSCTMRSCAGLQATRGIEPAGWREMRCRTRANGYLCRYQYESLCPAPRPGAASDLNFRAPFRLSSSTLDFSPPGTEVSATCRGEPPIAATCVAEAAGARWLGLARGAVLCPCPGQYLRGGRCARLPDCLDDSGGFACECAEGFELGKDGRSCVTQGEGQPAPGGTQVSIRSSVAVTEASLGPQRTWSPQARQASSATPSVPETLQWGPHSTLTTLQLSPQTKPAATVTPPGRVDTELNSTFSIPKAFDYSSTVVFILVGIAVVVLVILTMTVLGLFKLCFHKSPSSQPRKGPVGSPGEESDSEATALRSNSAPCLDNGAKARDCSVWAQAEDASLSRHSLGSGNT